MIGVDFGLTPSAAIGQMQGNQLVILDEIVTENMGAERFAELLFKHITVNYIPWSDTKNMVIMWIDPAGVAKSQSDKPHALRSLPSTSNLPQVQ